MKVEVMVTTLCGTALLLAGPAEAQRRPTGCGADKPVTVEVVDVANADADYGAGYVLRSDGGLYVHGVGKVDARIQVSNCSNDLVVLLGQSMPARRLRVYEGSDADVTDPFTTVSDFNFDRVGSVPRTDDPVAMYGPTGTGGYCGQTSYPTNQTTDGNYGGCGVDSSSATYVRRAVTLGWNIGTGHRLRMQEAPGDATQRCQLPEVCATSWVRVYHTADNQWVLSPEPVSQGGPAIAAHTRSTTKTGAQYLGSVALPFRIIVTTP